MLNAAVIGSPIAHSLSPVLHRAAYSMLDAEASYEKYEVASGKLRDFVSEHPEITALSVTMPHKNDAYELSHWRDEYAQLTGAVNTLVFDGQSIQGFNTDVYGIIRALKKDIKNGTSEAALVGAGATAHSALVALAELGITKVSLYVRSPHKTLEIQELAHKLKLDLEVVALYQAKINQSLILSTLPGTAAENYLNNFVFTAQSILFDVNYNPWPSELAAEALKHEAQIISGFEMLLHQAVRQVEIFTGLSFKRETLIETMRQSVRK